MNENFQLREQALGVPSVLEGEANLLIMPSLSEASISVSLVQSMTDCAVVGPVLQGLSRPAHVLTESCSVRDIVNMTAVVCVEAQQAVTSTRDTFEGHFDGVDEMDLRYT
jgi:malate dehydrogenase (oxaloacetate-decarboxylating)(NADP+)